MHAYTTYCKDTVALFEGMLISVLKELHVYSKLENFKVLLHLFAGRRQCLGEQLARMELFLYFATLLHRFQFQPPEGVSRLSEGSRFGISLRPEPFKVRAKRRNKDN